jgi:sialate O-acetylesterase
MEIIDESFDRLRLPRLISDGMVLQRGVALKIWGWAAPGGKITICFLGKPYYAEAGPDGKWTAALPALEAGGPYSMDIKADNDCIKVNNILIGDVWICSGQSNMAIPMSRVDDLYADEIARCENSAVRLFTVPERYDFKAPQQDLQSGAWESANPESILNFTAVGYFFAKALFEKYHLPIGLINASVGGSPAEAWMSGEALGAFPAHLEAVAMLKDDACLNRILEMDEALKSSWYNKLNKADKGMREGETPWSDVRYDASSWPVMSLPALWKEAGLGDLTGAVWFRKEIDIPASMAGKPARLLLGRIVDSDTVYVNGAFVGSTSYQYPPRKYSIAKGILKEGKNIIAVRVVNPSEQGGFIAGKPYRLEAEGRSIDLTGEWRYSVGAAAEPLPEGTFFQYKPLGLFNGMIAPLINYPIKGVIWYQGEANTSQPAGYHRLFSSLIADWRQKWGQGDFPFLYVQLPNYMPADDRPSESNWALLREEQLKTLEVPNTSMIVAIDLGEWNDLHPLNKRDIGVRLSLTARYLAYGDDKIVCSGPIYRSMKIEGNKIAIEFDNTGGGLAVRGNGGLKHFAIAGADKSFVWAKAKIRGCRVVVWSELVPDPVAVRYAWADNPEGANLYNKEGLPASPFRTDDW